MFFVLIETILGSWLVIRMFERLVEKHLFESASLTKIGTGYVLGVIFFAIILPKSHFWMWLANVFPLATVSISVTALVHERERAFREGIGELLTLIALKMKTGRSFRQSFGETIEQYQPHARTKLAEIFSSVVFSQQNRVRTERPYIEELIDEMIRIDRNPHLSLKRLSIFRESKRIESDFRRKSGQALSTVRAQSLIMSVLFLAVLLFVASQFGWRQNASLFILSMTAFVAGSVWIWRGGRKLKWKV